MAILDSPRKKFWGGYAIGLLAPLIGFTGYFLMLFQHMSFGEYIHWAMVRNDIQAPLLSLCLVVNLGVFYLFLNSNRENMAKGVLYGTFTYAPLVVYLKFF